MRKNIILPAAHGQLEKTNLGWPDLAFGMSSGASAVYGWIRLAELVPTNEFSRSHLLWRAGIFEICQTISILDQFGAATPQNYIYIYISRYGGPLYILVRVTLG